MNSFHAELRDISTTDEYVRCEVFYEGDHIYTVIDENGREWSRKELSIFDLNILAKHMREEAENEQEQVLWGFV